ncbi:MAG: ATP-binding cassette domain-containing protein [SAR324 cluster bacterium]|nr:ATP-binding cassette domain-containing protein [SAR324 cluster bacterium]
MIQLKNVTKSFGTKIVIDDLNLEIPRNKVTVIMGGSGHGKSTIIKLILGFIKPDAGEIIIDGINPLTLSKKERRDMLKMIGMSFQYSALFDSMSVYENVAFALREHHKHLSETEISERVVNILNRLGLYDIEDKMPSELSGGMKKRVGVARAVMLNPKIMIFDEPESGLDPITTTAIGNLMIEMRDEFNMTCLSISHHIPNSNRIGDKLAMLYRGKIIAEGSPEELQKLPNPILQQFINGRVEGPF